MNSDLKPMVLGNGLTLRFDDQSNRYFGDFHRICICVQICLPEQVALSAGLAGGKDFLERKLEKMGVPSESLEKERKILLDAFLATGLTYLEKKDFPQQLLLKLQKEKSRPVFLRN